MDQRLRLRRAVHGGATDDGGCLGVAAAAVAHRRRGCRPERWEHHGDVRLQAVLLT